MFLFGCAGFVGCFGEPAVIPGDDTSAGETSAASTVSSSSSDAFTSDAMSPTQGTDGESDGESTEGRTSIDPLDTTSSVVPSTDSEGASTSRSTSGPSGSDSGPGSCGDSQIDPGEVCDDGDNLGFLPDDCAPDCSAIVTQRTIRVAGNSQGDLGGAGMTAVEGADALCPVGFLAMFSDGSDRIATITANAGDGQVDWVLQPWVAYYNLDGEHVWTTDESALLGVVDGAAQNLLNAVGATNAVWTGLNADWRASMDVNCLNWTTSSGATTGPIGNYGQVTRAFLRVPDFSNTCDSNRAVYCAQQ